MQPLRGCAFLLAITAKVTQLCDVLSLMENSLSYVFFNRKISVVQEIVSTDTGEVLVHIESSVLKFTLQYFSVILLKYFQLLRESPNLYLTIRCYSDKSIQSNLDF